MVATGVFCARLFDFEMVGRVGAMPPKPYAFWRAPKAARNSSSDLGKARDVLLRRGVVEVTVDVVVTEVKEAVEGYDDAANIVASTGGVAVGGFVPRIVVV